MSKRFTALAAIAGAVASMSVLALSPVAGAASSLPTLNVALSGTKGISVSGSMTSGAVQVVSTFSGHAPSGPGGGAAYGLVLLRPGVTFQQAAGAVQSHHGDLNALTPYGILLVDTGAPGTIQTVLAPGNYAALNITGHGQPAVATFTVSQSSSPAALPTASATETAIEFGFRGPKTLHNGTIVRAQNHGWLVHMITLNGVKSKADGIALMAVLRRTTQLKAAKPFLNGTFIDLIGPSSPGAMQQMVLHAKRGWYVEACFMNTEDGRDHTQIGMERLVKVVN